MERIKELIKILNEANDAYYGDGNSTLRDKEYDDLYDELLALEEETGIVLSSSPTQNVGHTVQVKLPKEDHSKPMLSLSKTKSIEDIEEFVGQNEGVISWKLDGLTIVLTYENGNLVKALTRGNGTTGEVITDNAKKFKNIPLKIKDKGRLVIRGEALIKYSDFMKINEKLAEEEKYKNPRNLCSGSVRQLKSSETAKRNVYFYAFQLVELDKENDDAEKFSNKKTNSLDYLKEIGFDTVEYKIVTKDIVKDTILDFKEKIKTYDLPSDGLVVMYNDMKYSKSLGTTIKYPKDAIAFKWMDKPIETKLKEVIWNTSRTGSINPVAVFDAVEIDGTTVRQASLHNVSIIKELELGEGDTITVYKANMIIPQLDENKTRSNNLVIPKECPACFGETEIRKINTSEVLYCTNPNCIAKSISFMEHFVSRNCINIDGLSKATLKKFVEEGIIVNVEDIFLIKDKKDEILNLEGFKIKSFDNLVESIENAKNVKLANFINSLGIQIVGLAGAKLLAKKFGTLDNLINAKDYEILEIDGMGEIAAASITKYFNNKEFRNRVIELSKHLNIEEKVIDKNSINEKIEGKTFVITGSLENFKSREELKERIEEAGGKTSGSISAKTSYLINNDDKSTSSKNKKAIELNIPIITEKDILEMLG